MLTLRQLRYFVAVAEAGNITRAAEVMSVAPTALSLQMKALEDHFGTALVRRHSRGVTPTDAGVELLEQARRILGIVDETELRLGTRHGLPARPVRLGIPPGLTRLIGVGAFMGTSERFKGLTLQIVEGWTRELARRLEAGELDLVVGYGLDSTEAVEVTDLVEDRLVYIGRPDGISKNTPISLREALASNLIFYGEQSVGGRMVQAAASAANLPLRNGQHVESIGVWRQLIRQGVGTSIAPFAVIAEEFSLGEVAIRDLEGEPLVIRVSLGVRRELTG